MAPHAGAVAVRRRPVRVMPGAMLAFLALACSTDPPTEPLIPVLGVGITGAPADGVMRDGSALTLTATALGPGDEPLERHIEWSSTAPDVATVNDEGRVEAEALGTVEIRATSEGVTRAVTLSVREGTTVPGFGNSRVVTLLDGLLHLEIFVGSAPAGTVVHAREAVTWPPDVRIIAGTVVEIGPEGTQFAEPMRVGVTFVPTQIPAEEREELRLYGVDANGLWVELADPDVDLDSFRVEADMMRLTTVAIFRPAATP